jgi:hypothetical protein
MVKVALAVVAVVEQQLINTQLHQAYQHHLHF